MISFICTVLNEEKTIGDFLDSLLSQTRLPDEIIICDGGSTDRTVEKIQNSNFKFQNHSLKLKIKKGGNLNRSQGRNEAIKQAKGDIIVASDAGCILDKHWLEEITKPFGKDKTLDVVGGFYLPAGESIFQKILGLLTSIPLEKVNPLTFLPSSRSIAFKKSAWKKVGGYPKDLNYCEDLVFDLKLKKAGLKFAFAPRAIVFWPQKKTLKGAIKQFFNYAVGDGMAAQNGPHFKKILFKIFLTILLAILLFLSKNAAFIGLLACLGYLGIKAIKLTSRLKNPIALPLSLFLLPILNLTIILGFLWGLIKKK